MLPAHICFVVVVFLSFVALHDKSDCLNKKTKKGTSLIYYSKLDKLWLFWLDFCLILFLTVSTKYS